ncbi:hypothetical protein [Flavobacterium sp.]|uniref:hypothetical protein n=1 Tax=Flavobacterium sp. TaxID=239 RepID=UPI00286E8799|nr:hypothetical protein [Flavobacterium sp.]
MKKYIVYILIPIITAFIINSCTTEGKYEVEDTLVTVATKIPYLENPNARYRIDFGTTKLTDSLPFINSDGTQTVFESTVAYFKEKELTQDLKIWRLGASGTETLESTTPVTAPANGFISLLQLSDSSPLTVYNPIAPPADKTSQTNVQFFYANAAQPNQVRVTILAIDFIEFLTTAGQNFNNLTADKKSEIATFIINKGELRAPVTLDLKLFNSAGANAFFYKITDPVSGVILQDYKANSSITNSRIAITTTGTNPKFKFSLFQWGYTSSIVPFKATALIDGDVW